MRAWIEIDYFDTAEDDSRVALFMRAWIEIMQKFKFKVLQKKSPSS